MLNKIHNEDCVTFMKRLIPSNLRVDVIITSPPYNINKEYGSYNDNKQREEYKDWLFGIAKLSVSILKDSGSFFLNVGGIPSDPIFPFEVVSKFLDAGYRLQNIIHWVKSISIEKEDVGKSNGKQHEDFSIGHFKPIVSERYLTDIQEYVFHLTKTGNIKLNKRAIGVPYQDKSNIGRWKSANEDKRDRGNVWFITYPTINESRRHPAVFPEKLPFLCIKLHGVKKDMVIYDPFMGIGSTALACVRLGVNYIGTEVDTDYIRLANKEIDKRKKGVMDSWMEDNDKRMIFE